MRILVTGAAGYLGKSVITALARAGHEPVAMVRTYNSDIPHASEVRYSDLLDADALQKAMDGADAVCHLAGLTRARESLLQPIRYFRVNTGGTITLLETMAAVGIHRLVFASTGSIYGTPDRQPMNESLPDMPPHPYASSKLAAELAISAAAGNGELAAVVIRLLNVAGGFDPDPTRLIPRALQVASRDSILAVNGDGTAVRDYLHLDDAASAFVSCCDNIPEPGTTERYNIGSGTGTSVMDVVRAVERVTGRPIRIRHATPAPEPAALIADISKASAEMHWVPQCSEIDQIVANAWYGIGRSNAHP